MKKVILISLVAILFAACAGEKAKLLEAFDQQHQLIKSGQINQFHSIVDQESRDFISQMTDAENMEPAKLMQICKEVGLDYWCADYYTAMSAAVKSKPSKDHFFYYLVNSKTPLFQFKKDYYVVKEKSRVGDKNYVVLANDLEGGYRNVTWLQYITEGEEYKLKLMDILKQEEAKTAQIFYGYAKTQYDNRPPKDWKEKSLAEIYRLPVANHDYSSQSYDKSNR